MTTLDQYGITAALPSGWEGRIFKRDPGPLPPGVDSATPPERTNAIVHIANFPLPVEVDDYGGNAVEAMTNADLLVILVEFGPSSAGTALFATQGFPKLTKEDFSPATLQRGIDGQGATQHFLSIGERPFCLYVVLGSQLRRIRTVPVINDVLAGITVA